MEFLEARREPGLEPDLETPRSALEVCGVPLVSAMVGAVSAAVSIPSAFYSGSPWSRVDAMQRRILDWVLMM